MDWPGIVILLSMAAAILGGIVYGRPFGNNDFGRHRPRRNALDRPYREASHYRTSGVLPRWRR
jgi:hypothetical protein